VIRPLFRCYFCVDRVYDFKRLTCLGVSNAERPFVVYRRSEKLRGAPEMALNRTLRIYMLGRFEVRIGSRTVIDHSWPRRKAKAILKLLAMQEDKSLHRDQILELLWPGSDAAAGNNNLRQNLHHLRGALHAAGAGPPVLSNEMIALSPDAWIDIDAFRGAAQAAFRSPDDPILYAAALAIYRGDLLPMDLYEDWSLSRRKELQTLHRRLLSKVSQLEEAGGNIAGAAQLLRQAVEGDPLDEEVQRALMRFYARTSNRTEAIREYQNYIKLLQRELGVIPSHETEALYREIVNEG